MPVAASEVGATATPGSPRRVLMGGRLHQEHPRSR